MSITQEAGTDIPRLATGPGAAVAVADKDCMIDETARDNRVWQALDTQGHAFEHVNDDAVFARTEIMDEHDRPCFEFVPYWQT